MLSGNKDVDTIILNKLNDQDLVNVCQTNKKADEICKDQTFWLNRILIKYPILSMDILNRFKGNRSWSEYYINDLIRINTNNAKDYLVGGAETGRLDWIIIAINKGAKDIYHAIRVAEQNGNEDIAEFLFRYSYPSLSILSREILNKYKGDRLWDQYYIELIFIHDSNSNPYLYAGAKEGRLDYVILAVNNGAENIYDAIDIATKNKHEDVVEYLIAIPDKAIKHAEKYGHLETLKYLDQL